MKLKTKKFVFAGLCLLTIGSCVAGVWVPELFAIAGTSLIGTIAVAKYIIATPGADSATQTPEATTPVPAPDTLARGPRRSVSPSGPSNKPNLPSQKNLSPPRLIPEPIQVARDAEASPTPPALNRDFSMHISYKPEISPDGSISPNSIQVTVHTRTPSSPPRDIVPPPVKRNSGPNSPAPSAHVIQGRLVELASPKSPEVTRSPNKKAAHLRALKKNPPKMGSPK